MNEVGGAIGSRLFRSGVRPSLVHTRQTSTTSSEFAQQDEDDVVDSREDNNSHNATDRDEVCMSINCVGSWCGHACMVGWARTIAEQCIRLLSAVPVRLVRERKLQVLDRLPDHLAVSIISAAEGTLSESLETLPQTFHPLALCAHFPSITRERILNVTEGSAFKYPPVPGIFQALFTAAATFTTLRGLNIGPVSTLTATDEVVLSFSRVLGACKGLTTLSVHGGRRDQGFLTDSVAHAIARNLPHLPHLDSFELNAVHRLGGNQLAPESIRAVFEGLSCCTSLTMLTLTSISHDGSKTNKSSPLAATLMRLKKLETLKLRGSLTATNLRSLLGLMKELEGVSLVGLRHLDASNNGLGDEGSRALAPVLRRLPRLKNLDISENDIALHGAEALASAFSCMPQLRALNLMDNRLSDDGVDVLSTAWAGLTNIENLDISFCDISGEGSAVLSSAISRFSNLQNLNLNGCRLSVRFWQRRDGDHGTDDCAGARALGEALGCHSSLRHLSLMGTQLNSDAMTMLAPAFAKHEGLTSLDLQFNVQLGSLGITSLATHMKALGNLQCLRLSCFDVSSDAACDFAASIGCLTRMKRLGLLGWARSQLKLSQVLYATCRR